VKSITIHDLDESTEALIEEKARKEGLSLNKTVKMLLRQALGLEERGNGDQKAVLPSFPASGPPPLSRNSRRRPKTCAKSIHGTGDDVWIAAHAIETGSVLATFDSRFNKISGLRLWDVIRQ